MLPLSCDSVAFCSGAGASRESMPVRRCFAGLAASVTELVVLAIMGASGGVLGREGIREEEERRVGAIAVDRAREVQRLQALG